MQRQELTLEEEFMERDLAMERRLTTMMGIVVGSFVLCWSPFAVMFTIFPFCDDCSKYLKENSWIIEFITWIGESCICKTWLSYFSIMSVPVPSHHILTANKEPCNCYIAGYFNSSLNPMIYYFYYCHYFSKGSGGASRKQSAMSASWCLIYFEVLCLFFLILYSSLKLLCVWKASYYNSPVSYHLNTYVILLHNGQFIIHVYWIHSTLKWPFLWWQLHKCVWSIHFQKSFQLHI